MEWVHNICEFIRVTYQIVFFSIQQRRNFQIEIIITRQYAPCKQTVEHKPLNWERLKAYWVNFRKI
jgi:hypothetical protein